MRKVAGSGHFEHNDLVKFAGALVGAAAVVLSVSAAFSAGAVGWGLTLAVCFLIAIAATIAALRWRARAMASAMRQAFAAGEVLWGAQVRETVGGGRWGVSGLLLLDANATLSLIPDSASLRRGAVTQSWTPGQARLALLVDKRDVTGLAFTVLELRIPSHANRRFAAFHLTGQLPEDFRVPA